MLTADDPPLQIEAVAVLIAGRLFEGLDLIGGLVVAEGAVVWDVGEQQKPAGRVVHGTFGPPPTGPQMIDVGVVYDQPVETIVDDVDCRVQGHGCRCSRFRNPSRPDTPDTGAD